MQPKPASVPKKAAADSVSKRGSGDVITTTRRANPIHFGQSYSGALQDLNLKNPVGKHSEIEAVRHLLYEGFPKATFTQLKETLGVTAEELGAVVRIPTRTIARRTQFPPDESERILRVALAFNKAVEVLGDVESGRRWFLAPKRALEDNTPLAYCDTEAGAREVVNLLGRLEHGVFS